MKKITIEIKDAKGFLDKDALVQSFANQYDLAVAEETLDQDRIKEAVMALFAREKGVQYRGGYVESQVMAALGATTVTYPMLSKRLAAFLKENKGKRGEALFGMQMGRNPGLFLWADRPEEESKPES